MSDVTVAPATSKASQVARTSAHGSHIWYELMTTDPEGAKRFYNGTTIGAVCAPPPDTPAGWRYYIRVPSISQAAEATKEGGGTIAMGPHEVPGGDLIIIGKDPQGAEFALVGKA